MAFSATAQKILASTFGIVFVILIIVIALVVPKPSEFQLFVFRIVLALAAAGVAATIPGFITVQVGAWVRAGGAIAVFAVIYFFSPAKLVTEPPKQKSFEGFLFALRDDLSKTVPLEEFHLELGGPKKQELERFWIKEVTGKTWKEVAQKICGQYNGCLGCDPQPDQITNRVIIQISGDLVKGKTSEGAVMYSCAK